MRVAPAAAHPTSLCAGLRGPGPSSSDATRLLNKVIDHVDPAPLSHRAPDAIEF